MGQRTRIHTSAAGPGVDRREYRTSGAHGKKPAGHASSWGPTSLRLSLVSSATHPCTLETQKRRMVLRFIKMCFQLHSTAAYPLCSRVSLAHLQQPRLVSPHPCQGSASSKGSRVPWLSRWRRKLSVLSTPLLTNRSSVRRSWPQSVVGEGWALLLLHRSGLTTCGTRPCRRSLAGRARRFRVTCKSLPNLDSQKRLFSLFFLEKGSDTMCCRVVAHGCMAHAPR